MGRSKKSSRCAAKTARSAEEQVCIGWTLTGTTLTLDGYSLAQTFRKTNAIRSTHVAYIWMTWTRYPGVQSSRIQYN